MRVVVTERIHPEALALMRGAGFKVVEGAVLAEAPLREALTEAEAILVRTLPLPEALMAPPLRIIAKHGVGTDNIPLAAAAAAGITVTNTPGANALSVAEHTLMLILALARGLPHWHERMRPDRADAAVEPAPRMIELAGRRLLLIGYGRIGRAVAARAAAFGLKVQIWSHRAGSEAGGEIAPEGYEISRDLDRALAQADIVSLHCPLTPETRCLIDARRLALLRAGAFVINTARGGLIDEAALAAAAQSGRLGGFALDVFEAEPLPPDHPLRRVPGGILTPHVAAMSAEAFRRMGLEAAQSILDFHAGVLPPARVVTPAQ